MVGLFTRGLFGAHALDFSLLLLVFFSSGNGGIEIFQRGFGLGGYVCGHIAIVVFGKNGGLMLAHVQLLGAQALAV